MTIKTTHQLRLTIKDRVRTWVAQHDPFMLVFVSLFAPILIVVVLATRQHNQPAAPLDPIIVIATAQAVSPPTAAPVQRVTYPAAPIAQRMVVAFAAPDGAVLGPIPEPALSALTGRFGDQWVATTWQNATVWIRVSELGANLANAAPQAPLVVYQDAPQAPQYTIANEEPIDQAAPTPIAQANNEPNSLAARQALIGSDPNALACQNADGQASPLCGGMTNAEAQAALDAERQRQTNVQNHVANEHTDAATPSPALPDARQWTAPGASWCSEHTGDTPPAGCQ